MFPGRGPAPQTLTAQGKAMFEEGARYIFTHWTGLCLAVENQWGGPTSAQKADDLLRESIQWFYSSREHYADELREVLEKGLQEYFEEVDFEDNSPAQVANALVRLYQECLTGTSDFLNRMRAQVEEEARAGRQSAAARSRSQRVDNNGTVMEGEDGSSSSDEDDDDMDENVGEAGGPPQGPIVDADGFTLVQKRGRGGRR